MTWILGGSGYIGEAIVRAAQNEKKDHRSISRSELDYGDFRALLPALKKSKPTFVINAGGFTGKPNVDACERFKAETIEGNVTLALSVAQACDVAGIKLGSSFSAKPRILSDRCSNNSEIRGSLRRSSTAQDPSFRTIFAPV